MQALTRMGYQDRPIDDTSMSNPFVKADSHRTKKIEREARTMPTADI